MSWKREQSIAPPPGTYMIRTCDFEISQTSSKIPMFFLRKTKCTPAVVINLHVSFGNFCQNLSKQCQNNTTIA